MSRLLCMNDRKMNKSVCLLAIGLLLSQVSLVKGQTPNIDNARRGVHYMGCCQGSGWFRNRQSFGIQLTTIFHLHVRLGCKVIDVLDLQLGYIQVLDFLL